MLKIIRYFSKREWSLAGVAFLLILAQVWLDLKIPDYMKEITNLVQTSDSAMSAVLSSGGKMLLCAFGSLAAAASATVCVARIAAAFGASLRLRLYDRVMSFSMQELSSFSAASLITRSTNDVTQVQMFLVMGLRVIVQAPVTAVWAIAKIADKRSEWTLSVGAAVVVLLCVMTVAVLLVLPKFRRLQVLTDDLNRVTRENLNGLPVIRAYNADAYQEKKFEVANAALTNTHLFTGRAMAVLMPTIGLVMNGLSLAIYWIGAYLIQNAAMPLRPDLFSDMIVFSSYAMQVVMSFMMLVVIFLLLPRASVAAKRIMEVLQTKATIIDGQRTVPPVPGTIEFRNVSFRYPNSEEDVLKHISFSVQPGQTVAIIGATGSGKSSLLNLIPRFYDATQGQVLVGGADVREYTQMSLRNQIGYVSQRATLFSGSVESNIAFGDSGRPQAQQEEIDAALETAQATQFVSEMNANHYVAQGGANLSGGQKQRLSIARAVARGAEILLFDDSFSALDFKTDRAVRAALERQAHGATRLIVAQRIGTVRDADQILVLSDGELVGCGTHAELMKTCADYRDIAYSQLSKEELDVCQDQ